MTSSPTTVYPSDKPALQRFPRAPDWVPGNQKTSNLTVCLCQPQAIRIPDVPVIQKYHIPQIYQNTRLLKYQNTKIPDVPDIPKYQTIRIPEYQNTRYTKISDKPDVPLYSV